MRIVHVTDGYLPRLGGIELHVHDLADEQRRRGHDVVVLTRTAGADERPLADVPVVRVSAGQAGAELSRLIASAEVVHAHSSVVSPLAWASARRAGRLGVPTVVTMHSVVQQSALVCRGLRAVVAAAGPGVLWAAVSGVAARSLQPMVPRPVPVLPNGIDVDAWRPEPRPGREDGAPLTVVTVGRFAARKRILPLLEVLSEIRHQVDPVVPIRAVLAGDGPQLEAVRSRLRNSGMDQWVALPGRMTRAQVRALYSEADVFLAPAVLESFGLAALEARCAGLPVVARAQAGVGEFIRHGVEGLLVHDDRGMAVFTAALLQEPAALERISRHNRSVPTDLDWASVLDRGMGIYAVAARVSGSADATGSRTVTGTTPDRLDLAA